MRRIAAVTCVAAIGLLALVPAAEAHVKMYGTRTSTNVGVNINTGEYTFHGVVRSPFGPCVRKRDVRVTRRPSGGGPSEFVGSDTTDGKGAWSIDHLPGGGSWDYFVRVTRRVVRSNAAHRHVCRPFVASDPFYSHP